MCFCKELWKYYGLLNHFIYECCWHFFGFFKKHTHKLAVICRSNTDCLARKHFRWSTQFVFLFLLKMIKKISDLPHCIALRLCHQRPHLYMQVAIQCSFKKFIKLVSNLLNLSSGESLTRIWDFTVYKII